MVSTHVAVMLLLIVKMLVSYSDVSCFLQGIQLVCAVTSLWSQAKEADSRSSCGKETVPAGGMLRHGEEIS